MKLLYFLGLLKCSLQEFQHMFPYLTSRIKVQPSVSPNTEENNILFAPMECPILPLDTSMNCTDMLHDTFDEENGPLWRVQHVTEDSMDAANLVNTQCTKINVFILFLYFFLECSCSKGAFRLKK